MVAPQRMRARNAGGGYTYGHRTNERTNEQRKLSSERKYRSSERKISECLNETRVCGCEVATVEGNGTYHGLPTKARAHVIGMHGQHQLGVCDRRRSRHDRSGCGMRHVRYIECGGRLAGAQVRACVTNEGSKQTAKSAIKKRNAMATTKKHARHEMPSPNNTSQDPPTKRQRLGEQSKIKSRR